jgi:hypothetical protein
MSMPTTPGLAAGPAHSRRAVPDPEVPERATRRVYSARCYIGRRLADQRVALAIVAAEWALAVYHGDTMIKQLPLCGLHGKVLLFDRYVDRMQREAHAEARRRHHRLAA